MPVITKSHDTVVVDLQGQAFIRRADGQLHPLKLGDKVMRGDLILTSQDGIVELADPKPEDLLAMDPPAAGKAASNPLDRVIAVREPEPTCAMACWLACSSAAPCSSRRTARATASDGRASRTLPPAKCSWA